MFKKCGLRQHAAISELGSGLQVLVQEQISCKLLTVQEMYRNVQDENVQRNVQELRRFGQKCTTNVQEFCDGFVQKRSKPRPRFRGALTAYTGGKCQIQQISVVSDTIWT